VKPLGSLEETLAFIPEFLIKNGFAESGDTVIVTAGLRFGITGSTNMLVAITL
jgi:pyruvate kinase